MSPPTCSAPFRYSIHRIPTDSPHTPELVKRYKDAKLAALLAEPTGFAVQHVDEVHVSLNVWTKRLAPPSTIFICVATPDGDNNSVDDEEKLLSGEWVGFVTIRGPVPYGEYFLPESGQAVVETPELETRWHICNLYTAGAHRGRGIGTGLVNACNEFARNYSVGVPGTAISTVRLRLFMNPKKTALVAMYKRMSFQEAGKVTLKEGFIANGDAELVPQDTTSTAENILRCETRYGLAMERTINLIKDKTPGAYVSRVEADVQTLEDGRVV
ncbi:uncharacterized protein EI97DRAFT_434100 [Westerdykella ornata]|uniref:N-acetyltransferase domain-containing protein n=1 Tax=Westerdykella ornata TaxID=318751 RepID=A0A6A6JGX8_WESOR|nr:uncharacterized protein EI97DRAFT_434100 [Westerdykella ornata]KAF2275682.1 hypothetical protein EI97DRAFT_434100 [Westerdykella ornata]